MLSHPSISFRRLEPRSEGFASFGSQDEMNCVDPDAEGVVPGVKSCVSGVVE